MSKERQAVAVLLGVDDLHTHVNRSLHLPPDSIVSVAVGLTFCHGPCCPDALFQETYSHPWLPGHVTFLLNYLPDLW